MKRLLLYTTVKPLVILAGFFQTGFWAKPSLWGTCVFFLIPSLAVAEDAPKAELFGGYSYFGTRDPRVDLNGWNGSISGNLNNWFGVVGDFSGHYGSLSSGVFDLPGLRNLVDVNLHSFLLGPRFSFRNNETVTPFAHGLIGGARANGGAFGFSLSERALAAAFGGGIDIKINDVLAVRAVQADYVVTRFLDETQRSVRLSFGLVWRIGTR